MTLTLEKFLFYFLILCLPFQTRKIIYQWFTSSTGGGSDFNEWTSAYLYLTDLLILLIFLLWAWRKRKERFFKKGILIGQFSERIKNPSFWLVIFLIISLISLVQAKNIQLGFYQWLKLLEMAGLFFYLKHNFRRLFTFKRLTQVFMASSLFQSFIALGQYANQKNLGLRILRESPFGPEITGVAKIVVEKIELIRPYGTFPHPNLLAAFLLVGLFCFFFIYFRQKPWSKKFILGGLTKKDFFPKNGFLLAGIYPLFLFTLLLTFSRLTIFTFLLASILFFIWIFFRQPLLRTKTIELFLLLVIFSSLFSILLWPEISWRFSLSLTEQSVSLRAFYNETALSIITEHPWLGIGLGNFVWEIRQMLDLLANWLHQPVHNIYLLIASETGLINLVVFLFFIWSLLWQFGSATPKKGVALPGFIIFSFLFIGLFDHFFLTLQQGQLIFWLVLGLIAAYSSGRKLSTV